VKSLLARYGLPLALVWLYLYPFPYFAQIRSANELPRIYLTRAMAKEGTFAIDSGVRRWGVTADVSRAHGHYYSNKAPGSSFLAVPGYLVLGAVKTIQGVDEPSLAEMFWVSRFTTGVLPSLLFLWLLSHFLRRFSGPDGVRMAVIGYGLGSMALTYSILFIAHQLSAVCIGTAYILGVWVAEDGRDARWMWACGFAAGCAPLVDYQAAFAGVPVAVYLACKLLSRRRWLPLLYAALGAALPVALLLFYHHQAFGSPFKTGYDFSETFAHFHQQGFLGMTELRWEAFAGSTVAPDNGLIVFCPMLLLAVPGWFFMARRRLYWHLCVTAAVVVIYLLFISSINFWRGGWQLGPRYVTAMLPFVMVPVAVFLDRASERWPMRALSIALVAVGVVVYALSSVAFPHFPEIFANPLYEVTFRLLGEGLAPYSLGWALGLRGWVSLLPYLAVLAAVVVYMALPGRGYWRSAILGLAGAALIIAAYSRFDRGGPRADQTYQRITSMMPR
jgi:hypothetical protein